MNKIISLRHQHASLVPLNASDKEEEIAKLEEQLRKLKDQAANDERIDEDISGNLNDGVEEVVPESMFLSENWKEGDEETEASTSLTSVLSAVGLALVLVIFSQIPIGQEDLSKYSASTSTEKIDLGDLNRARQSGDL
jgi:hypothetical protein